MIKIAVKLIFSLAYSILATNVIVQRNDSYEAVFTDIFFYVAAMLGTALMLLVEKADPKTTRQISKRRVAFSVVACMAVIYVAGTVRASMLHEEEFERNHWFYAIVMFLCAIAPELIRLIITDSPGAIAKGFNKGIERRIDKMVGGDSGSVPPEDLFNENSEGNE